MLNLNKTTLMNRAFYDNYRMNEFCREFGCSEQMIKERIHSVCNNDKKEAEGLLKRIKKNGKVERPENPLVEKRRLQRIASEKGVSVAVENAKVDLTPKAKPVSAKKVEPKEEAVSTKVDVMAELKATEELVSNDVIQIEIAMEKLRNQHRDHVAAGRKLADEAEILRKQLGDLQTRAMDVQRKDDIVVEKLDAVTADWEVKRAELEKVRAKIAELSAVLLFVCDDSEVVLATENEEVSELLASITHEELMEKIFAIFNTGLCRNLLNRDIEALAKIFILKEKTELRIDAEFDNKDVELTYELVAKKLAA